MTGFSYRYEEFIYESTVYWLNGGICVMYYTQLENQHRKFTEYSFYDLSLINGDLATPLERIRGDRLCVQT